ncbi:hypothetical protein OC861_002320 [Tilletia horrida]|nr:hypothetical protein OC861_002320 [Tilletia horrida]
MSRHRAVRNLDIDAILTADDGYDEVEDPYEDITDQERADLNSALRGVIEIIGPASQSGFSDREIKDVLWDSYFDVPSTVTHFLDEQHKKQAKAIKKQDDESLAEQGLATTTPAATARPEPAKPMTALQRLAAARQNQRQTATPPATASTPTTQSPAPAPEKPAAPKSKLAALAAARAKTSAPSSTVAPKEVISSTPVPTISPAPPAKPLSRLQQKIQAAQEAKARQANASNGGAEAVPMDIIPDTTSASTGNVQESSAQQYARAQLASGLAVALLFPIATKEDAHKALPKSFDRMQLDDVGQTSDAYIQSSPDFGEAHVAATHIAATFGPGLMATVRDAGQQGNVNISASATQSPNTIRSHATQFPHLFPLRRSDASSADSHVDGLRAAFAGPSPDDKVLQAREGTRLGVGGRTAPAKRAAPVAASEAAERKKAAAASAGSSNNASRIGSGAATPNVRSDNPGKQTPQKKAAATGQSGDRAEPVQVSQLQSDIEGLGLSGNRNINVGDGGEENAGTGSKGTAEVQKAKAAAKVAVSNEKIIEAWEKQQQTGKASLSLIVVGHVDAGKSTLMGKLLHELGRVTDREQSANERASARIGKGSFAYAWALDSSEEERSRGVTIDIAQDTFSTAHRHFTLLDAPGHRDFIPNMISGSAQADAAILVIDASIGAFEAGFGPNGQTREHALLLRSLGVQQLVVVVNKLDAVEWDQARFDEIHAELKPFLSRTGFDVNKINFIPCGAAMGENLGARTDDSPLNAWYSGATLLDVLDALEPPSRQLRSPVRMPLTNVFKGQTAIASGIGAAGRLLTGVVQVGDRLRVVPGDESAVIKTIEADEEQVPWAVAGTNVTLYLTSIDQMHVNIGSVLCTPAAEVPICSTFIAQVLVFEPTYPLVAGSQVELFHHSANVPATLTELISITDKTTGQATKRKPRVLAKGVTALVRITVQAGGAAGQSRGIPVEDFKTNKDMARVLLRREGQTVAAGIITELATS